MAGGYVGYLGPEVGVESKLRWPSYCGYYRLIFVGFLNLEPCPTAVEGEIRVVKRSSGEGLQDTTSRVCSDTL
jgi:hypothetical protein